MFRSGFITVLRRQLERQSRNASTRPKAPSTPPRSFPMPIGLRNKSQQSSTSGNRSYTGNRLRRAAGQSRWRYRSLISTKPSWLGLLSLPSCCSLSFGLVLNNKQRREQSPNEILGNHREQSQQSRLELGLRLSRGFSRANNLDCWRTSRRRKAVHHAGG